MLVYDGATFGPDYLNTVFIADLVQGWIEVLTGELVRIAPAGSSTSTATLA